MTQREHQLTYCEICRNKGFSPRKGIICSLTEDVATFDHTCKDFDEDESLRKMNDLASEAKKIEATRESTFGLSRIGITNGAVAGAIYIVLGIATVFLTIFAFEVITIWSFVIMIIGIVLIVKAISNRGKTKKIKNRPVDLLDDEIL